MRRALVVIGLAFGLVVASALPAEANINLRPTAPVYYLGPFYGWPAWCGLVGWQIDSNGVSISASVVIGSTVDAGGGTCAEANSIAFADMNAVLLVKRQGFQVCIAFTSVGGYSYRSGANQCYITPGWHTVEVGGTWRLHANGATISYTSPPFPVYIS